MMPREKDYQLIHIANAFWGLSRNVSQSASIWLIPLKQDALYNGTPTAPTHIE